MSVSTKPASGFRDFLPAEARQRRAVFSVVEDVYQSYGFEPLDTPCVERLDTLLGKYGDEGDQLVFKVLKRGAKLEKAVASAPAEAVSAALETHLADLGLRYDLTVPLARVVAQYKNDLPRIFKRYQLAPVWRADRPQRGRFREFYQCDVDVIGSSSMVVEAEVCAALSEILDRLQFDSFRIHLNHRKLLSALMQVSGVPTEQEGTALVALDKLDKIGVEGVRSELENRGIATPTAESLLSMFETIDAATDNAARMASLRAIEGLAALPDGAEALADLGDILSMAEVTAAGPHLVLDPFLARGLSYYTGPIFEIRSDDFPGSLGGGGRYDELIGMFGKESIPACGFSLGIERILVLLEERGVELSSGAPADVLVTLFDAASTPASLALACELRGRGLRVDVYPDPGKYKRQFKHASQCAIPFVVLLGPRELEQGEVVLKDMGSGEQTTFAASAAAEAIAGTVHD